MDLERVLRCLRFFLVLELFFRGKGVVSKQLSNGHPRPAVPPEMQQQLLQQVMAMGFPEPLARQVPRHPLLR